MVKRREEKEKKSIPISLNPATFPDPELNGIKQTNRQKNAVDWSSRYLLPEDFDLTFLWLHSKRIRKFQKER